MSKQSLIRTIYLYLFATLGLVLLTIGGVILIELGLKMTIFQKADIDRLSRPIMAPMIIEKTIQEADFVSVLEKCNTDPGCDFTDEDKELIQSWLADYSQWKQQDAEISYTTQQHQRQASRAIALILIGLPLYLYHWTVIKMDIKKSKS